MKLELSAVLFSDDGERIFGKGPYLLLRGIREHGSLNAAAKEMDMAYSKAYAVMKRAETALGGELTAKNIGGKNGGGSVLTEKGERVLAAWEKLIAEKQRMEKELYEHCLNEILTPCRIGCVVLASGKSLRFGGNKMLADLIGKPLLSHTLSSIDRTLFEKVTVVVSDRTVEKVASDAGFDTCFYEGGPVSESIRMGLSSLPETAGCLFVNGDQPLISEKSIRRMVSAFRLDPSAGLRLSFGDEQGNPVLFPSKWYPDLMALTGEKGGMSAVRARGECFSGVQAENSRELLDADTPEALEIIRASML